MKRILLFSAPLLFIVVLILLLNFSTQETKAGAAHNVTGWAWSETIGWISFNNRNCDADNDGLSNGSPVGCPSAGQPIANYGVNLDASGNISGYAWSENIGWISFQPADVLGCPTIPCSPQLNLANGEVSGWARACAGTVNGNCTGATRTDGWDGWIHLRGTAQDSSIYGVTVSGPTWNGWAWGSDVVGWIHFKDVTYGVGGGGTTPPNPPTGGGPGGSPKAEGGGISVPPGSGTNPALLAFGENVPGACTEPGRPTFSWIYSDPLSRPQSAFQIQVDDDPIFASPADIGAGGSKYLSESARAYQLPLDKTLPYGITYHWRVRVWNSADIVSEWSPGPDFSTQSHQGPSVSFNWTPLNPEIGQNTNFNSTATLTFGGFTVLSRSWNFPDGTPSTSSLENPINIQFSSRGAKNVTLIVMDTGNLSCGLGQTVNVGVLTGIPAWKEIVPSP